MCCDVLKFKHREDRCLKSTREDLMMVLKCSFQLSLSSRVALRGLVDNNRGGTGIDVKLI